MNSPPDLRPTDVVAVYQHLLGRDPREEEVGHQLATISTLAELLQMVLSSEEYAHRRGAPAPPPPGGHQVVNIFHPDLAAWTYPAGSRSADGVAIVGREGWLFLCGGTNANLEQFLGRVPMQDDWLDGWRTTFAKRERDLGAMGATGVTMVVPDKLAVYEQQYPEALLREGRRPVELLQQTGNMPMLYPLADLQDAASLAGMYLRTDTHVSLLGNAMLFDCLAAALDCVAPFALSGTPTFEYLMSGDLGSRFTPPVLEVVPTVGSLLDARIVADNREEIAAVGGHIGTHRVFANDTAPDDRTVVIFGDSFGFGAKNYQGLSWFLAQTFREVHFVWVPFGWDPVYAERVGAQLVVFQGAERFLGRVPLGSVDVAQLAVETLSRKQGLDLSAAFTD